MHHNWCFLQVVLSFECLRTEATRIFALIAVGQFVLGQSTWIVEQLATDLTSNNRPTTRTNVSTNCHLCWATFGSRNCLLVFHSRWLKSVNWIDPGVLFFWMIISVCKQHTHNKTQSVIWPQSTFYIQIKQHIQKIC